VPSVRAYASDRDEARGVARAARGRHRPGAPWSRIAVLVRTNAQAALLQEAFREAQVPCRVRGGGAFLAGSISGGNWNTTTTTLDTAAGSDYAGVTVIDLRFRSMAAGASPGIVLNAFRNGTTCAPLGVALQLQSDGTQTLNITGKTSDSTSKVLLNKPGLANGLIDLRLIIDPATVSVGVILNTVPIGTYPLPRFASGDPSRILSLLPGNGGQFQYVRIREIDTKP